jgi:hypothetical protein
MAQADLRTRSEPFLPLVGVRSTSLATRLPRTSDAGHGIGDGGIETRHTLLCHSTAASALLGAHLYTISLRFVSTLLREIARMYGSWTVAVLVEPWAPQRVAADQTAA